MRYKRLELKGFVRTSLAGIYDFVIEPEKPTQIILGTNGSGKSSLLSQLSPDPAVKSDYLKDGYKKIWIEHNNQEYLLTTEFQHGTKCSFTNLTTGEVYNDNGTAKVQEQLIRQILGYKPEIHALMTGLEKFTSMATSRRREWFTLMSDTDYTFAIRLFNKAKENLRDVSGALKQAKKRLNEEYSLIITEEEQLKINENIKVIEERIDDLRSKLVRPLNMNKEMMTSTLNGLLQQMSRMSSAAFKHRNVIMKTGIETNSEQALRDELEKHVGQIAYLSGSVERLVEEYDRITSTINNARNNTSKNKQELLNNFDNLVSEISKIESRLNSDFDYSNALVKLSILRNVSDDLVSIFQNIPFNNEGKYSDNQIAFLREQKHKLGDFLNRVDAKIATLEEKENNLEEHKHQANVDCPKCGHNWIPGYNEKDLSDVKNSLINGRKIRKEKTEELKHIESQLEEQIEYSKLIDRYVFIMERNQELFVLREYIYKNRLLTDNPREAIGVINKYLLELESAVKVAKMEESKLSIKKELDAMENKEDVDLKSLELRQQTIEKELHTFNIEQRRSTELKNETQLKLDSLMSYEKAIENLKKARDEMTGLETNVVQVMLFEEVTNLIRNEQTHLAVLINRSKDIESRMTVIREIESNIDRYTDDEKVLSEIVDSLSPTSGLIADGLFGFIKIVLKQMNSIIKSVWTYPLVITLPEFDDGSSELNYRFPMIVGDNGLQPKDINLGSDGIKEIVDLAFKMVAMKYLGLSKFPMKLDEFGKGFDVEHRQRLTSFIKAFMESGECEQLFLVSHYVESYGALPNSDVCVVYDKNIIIPKESFNNHVLINGIRNMYNVK